MNNIQMDRQNKRYKKKYKYMKIKVKNLIAENAALCDEVAKVQESIAIVKDERKFLFCKLMEYENDAEMSQLYYRSDSSHPNGARTKPKKRRSHEEGGGKL